MRAVVFVLLIVLPLPLESSEVSLSLRQDEGLEHVGAPHISSISATSADDPSNGAGLVVAGRRFSFFIRPGEGIVWAMGKNNHGQLGIGSFNDTFHPTPVQMPEGTFVISIAASAFHAFFLTQEGDVYATGWNRWGQFGTGGSGDERASTPIKIHSNVKEISTGYGHTLFLMRDQTVQVCGLNSAGQLGDGTTITRRVRFVLGLVQFAPGVNQVAAGYDFSYFSVEPYDEIWAVGQNLGGQLGDDTRVTRLTPVRTYISNSQRIVAGQSHAILRSRGNIWGTGSNVFGQLGASVGSGQIVTRPTLMRDFPSSVDTWVGGDSSCTWFDQAGGVLLCAGSNLDGQLGLNDTLFSRFPQHVEGLRTEHMSIGDSHTLAMEQDYTDFVLTGTNANGELGDGTDIARNLFKEFGLDLSTSTTSSVTQTSSTKTATSSTYTSTTVYRAPTRGEDGTADDMAMMQMLQVLLGMGVAAILLGLVVRRFAPVEEADSVLLHTSEAVELRSTGHTASEQNPP